MKRPNYREGGKPKLRNATQEYVDSILESFKWGEIKKIVGDHRRVLMEYLSSCASSNAHTKSEQRRLDVFAALDGTLQKYGPNALRVRPEVAEDTIARTREVLRFLRKGGV